MPPFWQPGPEVVLSMMTSAMPSGLTKDEHPPNGPGAGPWLPQGPRPRSSPSTPPMVMVLADAALSLVKVLHNSTPSPGMPGNSSKSRSITRTSNSANSPGTSTSTGVQSSFPPVLLAEEPVPSVLALELVEGPEFSAVASASSVVLTSVPSSSAIEVVPIAVVDADVEEVPSESPSPTGEGSEKQLVVLIAAATIKITLERTTEPRRPSESVSSASKLTIPVKFEGGQIAERPYCRHRGREHVPGEPRPQRAAPCSAQAPVH